MKTGTLFLIPCSLGADSPLPDLAPRAVDITNDLKYFLAENPKTARRFLAQLEGHQTMQELEFFEINKHSRIAEHPEFLDPLREGKDMGFLSEAGLPCMADPGASVVTQAYKIGARVVPLPGPGSIYLALMASGFNGQQFVFHGYIPRDSKERKDTLRQYAVEAGKGYTQLFMDTPYRSQAVFDEILKVCDDGVYLSVAADLTMESEFVRTLSLYEWKKNKPNLHKRPCIFAFGMPANF